ncbi:OLC1v1008567C1 [Oldenlandia corymbosa var. corymbosa]|uniref:OLC1v1008567C1 n=1 Tax=Oldenlandia corymbosa var. corymbosa TaxID=529605 RepID=A0AAV1DLZ4_OLDCO|nr:OLC1v1008567C1 [Oldenlandia corymbosa var. corymbosa]
MATLMMDGWAFKNADMVKIKTKKEKEMATKEKKESWKPRKESGNGKGKRKRRGSEEDDIVMIDPLVVKGNGKGEEKKKKKKMEEAVQKEEEGVVPALEKEGNDVDIDKTADWCLVCKDGGTLRICDYPKCGKVYHFSCLKKSISFMRSDAYWQCPRHTCYRCQGTAIVSCYCCPSAACSNCFRDAEFVCIGDENGFCKKCMKFVLHFEKKTRRKPSDESTSYEDFMEYYEAVKKKSGFTLNDIQAAFKGLKSRGKRKSSTLFKAEVTERLGGLQKMRSDSSKTPWDEENPLSDIIMVPSLVAENVKIIYLTRSVIEKLLRQPESFEDKVKGSFVGVDFPRKGNPNKVDRQLLQVIGIAKTLSHDGQMSIKLQAKNMPNGISIDMVSNLDFRENLCKDLRQKVEDGLIEMPAIEELERKAEVLSEDIVDDLIARDMKRLQQDSDTANEKGLRQKYPFIGVAEFTC